MSYVFFNYVLAALGKKLNFESISNMYGKTVFDKKGGDAINKMIQQANPLYKQSAKNSAAMLLSMPGTLAIINSGEGQKEAATKALGDMSWFEEYLK
jgi:hypothetical protein